MITIYTPLSSPRLEYVLNYLFKYRMGVHYDLTNDPATVNSDSRMNINYSASPISGFYNINPHGLLASTGIQTIEAVVSEFNGMKVLFKNEGDLGYDIFSAVFYSLSRYEEYGTNKKDIHGRFIYKDSFLWKGNALQLPLVDIWMEDFKNKLIHEFGFKIGDFKVSEFSVLPTMDIDSVFAYKGRNLIRQIAGFSKAALTFNFSEIVSRFNVLAGKKQDPNENFNYQFEQFDKHFQKANYFIQIGRYGKYDKNISATNLSFQEILRSIIKNGHSVGLHPSYHSNSDFDMIKREKETLERIIGQPVIASRQHYLRFSLPKTYRVLILLGIQKEFSMGYSEVAGFRAATSRPFLWYDLEKEKETKLEIIPFCVMDVAYKQFAESDPQGAIEESGLMKESIQSVNGIFSFVFHNESLSNHRGWKGWRQVFETWLKK